MTKVAVYPGTFDPITLGHLDVIQRAAQLFDEVVVAVAVSSRKSPLFSVEERVSMCLEAVANLTNVKVSLLEGLTVDFARQQKANYIVRGVRSIADVDYELQIATMNQDMAPDIETIFLPTSKKYANVSATILREIMQFDVERLKLFVPQNVYEKIKDNSNGA